MSKPNDTTPVINIAPEAETETAEVVEKQSFVAKTKNFVKNHKKPAIAVGALVGLVGVSALVGRKTAPSTDLYDSDPTAEATETAEAALEELGIPVTNEN